MKLTIKGDKINTSKIEQEYFFFISYLRSLTTSAIDRVTLFRILPQKKAFPNIAKVMKRIYVLSEKWRYGQAAACESVSRNLRSKVLRVFLFKLAQSIRAGEPIKDFIEREYKNYMIILPEQNRRKMQRLKMLADAYSSFFTSGILLTVTFLLATMLTNMSNAIEILVIAVMSLGIALATLSLLIYNTAMPEDVLVEDKIKPRKRVILNLIGTISVIAAFLLGSISFMITPSYALSLAGLPLLLSGFLGKRYVDKVKKCEEEYKNFLRNFMASMGGGTSTVLSLKNALLVKYGAGLGSILKGLYSKLVFRINPRIAWNAFEIEVGSKLIRRINEIIVDVIYEGGDIEQVSKIVDDVYTTFLELRSRRYQIVSYLKGLLVPLHSTMGLLFGVIYSFFSVLSEFLTALSLTINIINIPNLFFLEMFFLFAITLFSIANAMALYFMEGDSRFSFILYIGLFLFLGNTTYQIAYNLTEQYFSSIRF